MNEKHLAQLEATLEELVEGAFTNLFRKRVNAHDIAMKLARSMENSLRYSPDGDARPLAPDAYAIYLHPNVQAQLTTNRPNLNQSLAEHLVELASKAGYRLSSTPIVRFLSDSKLDTGEVEVSASHSSSEGGTQAMQPIPMDAKAPKPKNPQLIINGERRLELKDPILNIGRSDDNHIVLDDAACSRHHIQLRLRFGVYTVFDVNSRGGTYVNNVRVTEHRLQTGDVILIGNSRLVYMTEDERAGEPPTQTLYPGDF